jgi:glycosyltransferase involved in cell wall biosynthesis
MPNHLPEISIIIPTYNYGRFIGRALNSVLSQSYQDYEIIVVDDASTDDTKKIVGQYDDLRMRYIKHKVNCGPSKTRNTGIEASKGMYIAFLDSDDTWMPKKIESQIEVFRKGPDNLGVVYTSMKIFDESMSKTFSPPPSTCRGQVLLQLLTANHLGGGSSAVMIKRECFNKAGLFDISIRGNEDWDMWIRLACFYLFEYIDKVLVTLTTHSFNSSADAKRMINGREILLQKHVSLYRRYPEIHSNQHYILGIQCFKEGMMDKGRKHFLQAFRYSSPRNIPIKLRSMMQILTSAAGFKGYMTIKRILGI